VVKRSGIADGWLRGKDKLRENFAVGVKAPRLSFTLVDVTVGVNAMCFIHRRENGAVATAMVALDANGKARRMVSCYGKPTGEPRLFDLSDRVTRLRILSPHSARTIVSRRDS